MDYTIENKIFNRMKKANRGLVFFPNDFVAYGNSKACNKALERLHLTLSPESKSDSSN